MHQKIRRIIIAAVEKSADPFSNDSLSLFLSLATPLRGNFSGRGSAVGTIRLGLVERARSIMRSCG